MRAESLQEVIRATPFRSFALLLANGERVPVPHPDWIWLRTGGRTVVWMDEKERVRILDIALLVGVEMDQPVPAGSIAPNTNGGE